MCVCNHFGACVFVLCVRASLVCVCSRVYAILVRVYNCFAACVYFLCVRAILVCVCVRVQLFGVRACV